MINAICFFVNLLFVHKFLFLSPPAISIVTHKNVLVNTKKEQNVIKMT
uniref:Uncharacterized protein n=1 Tax=Siphoviridae sp. ct5zp6 TaxID=2826296 RepID=A0A8S5NSU2_9CAUD|nr:MAG TPA: hypothetical protein [Siphoviridae sp. ct5zp6]